MNLLHYKNITKSVKFDYTKNEHYNFLYGSNDKFRKISDIRNSTNYQIQDNENNIYTLELNRRLDDIRYIEDVNGIRYYFCYRVNEECLEDFKLKKIYNDYCFDTHIIPKRTNKYNIEKFHIGFLYREKNLFYTFHCEPKYIYSHSNFYTEEECRIAFLKDAAGLKKVVYRNGDTYYYLKDYEYILSDAYKDKSLGWQWQVYQRAKNKLPIIRDINNKEYFYSKNSVNNDYLIDKKGKRYFLTIKNDKVWLKMSFYQFFIEPGDPKYDFRCDTYSPDGIKYRKSKFECFFRYSSSVLPIGYILHKQYVKNNLMRKVRKYKLKFSI